VRDALFLQVFHGGEEVVPEALQEIQVQGPRVQQTSRQGLAPRHLQDQSHPLAQLEGLHQPHDVAVIQLGQDLSLLLEAGVVGRIASQFQDPKVVIQLHQPGL